MKTLSSFFTAILASSVLTIQAQEIQGKLSVGISAFSSSRLQDSLVAKYVNSTVARVLVQTQKFNIVDISQWEKTQKEIERQKSAAFIDNDIIQKGKSNGARILVVGTVKNVEIYQQGKQYTTRVDYDVQFIDVESDNSLKFNSFKGDSKDFHITNYQVFRKGLSRFFHRPRTTASKPSKILSGSGEAAVSVERGNLIDAIESTADSLKAWLRRTSRIDLLYLGASDENRKKGFQHVLVEGGNNISMSVRDKLKLIIIRQFDTEHGPIRDEDPVADLEVIEVRSETSLCKVLNGGKKISGMQAQVDGYRIMII